LQLSAISLLVEASAMCDDDVRLQVRRRVTYLMNTVPFDAVSRFTHACAHPNKIVC